MTTATEQRTPYLSTDDLDEMRQAVARWRREGGGDLAAQLAAHVNALLRERAVLVANRDATTAVAGEAVSVLRRLGRTVPSGDIHALADLLMLAGAVVKKHDRMP